MTSARSFSLAGVVVPEVRMAKPSSSPADIIERLARDLHRLAFDLREPSRSIERSERLIDRAEGIAAAVRATVRGRNQAHRGVEQAGSSSAS